MKKIVAVFMFAVHVLKAQAATPAAPPAAPPAATDMRAIALRIVELETKRQKVTGSVASIDSLLTLYSDSVVYEHPTMSAVVRGKQNMRRNMLAYVGSIRSVTATPPRVTVGHQVAIVETSSRMEVLDGAKWTPVSRHGIRVIEFDAHGLVRRILDYPW
ncbi:MAG TPA: nuclear transport factor 2 family protein [Gemmatimonadaceae bacterium]|nr:nuclear transport factor 2 family protein [Gemmatimonadaceae bacterium]